MKYLFVIILAIFILGGGYWYLNRSTEPALGSGPVIAFGDSLTKGTGSTPGHDFVSRLSAATGREIQNQGENEDTTAGALVRLDNILQEKPSLVIVFLGGNDVLQGVSSDQTLMNISQIVSLIRASGAKVLLLGLGPIGPESAHISSGLERIAKENSARYIPDVLSGIEGNPSFMSDEVHPNDAGYAIIAERVRPEFSKMTVK